MPRKQINCPPEHPLDTVVRAGSAAVLAVSVGFTSLGCDKGCTPLIDPNFLLFMLSTISFYHSPVPSPLCPSLIFFLPYIPSKTELLAGKMVFHQYDKSCGLNLGTQIHHSSSLSRDPLDYVRLVINTTLGYGITASGEIGTLWDQ